MKNAEMKVVKFDNSDVIATSTSYTFKGFCDGESGNASINNMNQADFYNYMVKTNMVTDTTEAGKTKVWISAFTNPTINDLFGSEGESYADYVSIFNGPFVWNAENKRFTKQ